MPEIDPRFYEALLSNFGRSFEMGEEGGKEVRCGGLRDCTAVAIIFLRPYTLALPIKVVGFSQMPTSSKRKMKVGSETVCINCITSILIDLQTTAKLISVAFSLSLSSL